MAAEERPSVSTSVQNGRVEFDLPIGNDIPLIVRTTGEGKDLQQPFEPKFRDEEWATVQAVNIHGEIARSTLPRSKAILLVLTLCGAAFLNVCSWRFPCSLDSKLRARASPIIYFTC